MFDHFDTAARRTMAAARQAAETLGHDYIGTEHLLLGLCAQPDSVACRIVMGLGVEPTAVQAATARSVKRTGKVVPNQLPFTPDSKRVLEGAMNVASELGDDFIGSEHVLLGLIDEGRGTAATVLASLGVERSAVHRAIVALRPARDEVPLAHAVTRMLAHARREAESRGHERVEVRHVLLAALASPHAPVADWVRATGLHHEVLLASLRRALDQEQPRGDA